MEVAAPARATDGHIWVVMMEKEAVNGSVTMASASCFGLVVVGLWAEWRIW